MKLRVPLSVIIDYKGFRCLAIAKVPVNGNQGPLLGFDGGNYIKDEPTCQIYDAFRRVGEELNLKSNYAASMKTSSRDAVPVSLFAQVFKCADDQK